MAFAQSLEKYLYSRTRHPTAETLSPGKSLEFAIYERGRNSLPWE
jgi:hypothetical protein